MRIKQLGNGGGLNPQLTNSSFLIEYTSNQFLLFDCGFNIMDRLIKLEEDSVKHDASFRISKIDIVFVSHTDDDHIGNLQTLIYWNYFKNQKKMEIISHNEVFDIIDKMNTIKTAGIVEDFKYFIKIDISNRKEVYYNLVSDSMLKLTFIKAYHGSRKCYGLLAIKSNKAIYISGDTVAHPSIENTVTKEIKLQQNISGSNLNSIMFHDYSHWDCPSKNVHACKTNFEEEYSKEFRDKLIKYHTGEDDFNKDWRIL
jgi:ribonuclease BN (tRNA processing enzyme)